MNGRHGVRAGRRGWWLALVLAAAVLAGAGCRPADEPVAGGTGPAEGPAAPEPVSAPATPAPAPAPAPATPAPAPDPARAAAAPDAAGWIDCRPGAGGEWQVVAGDKGGWDEAAGVLRIPAGFDLAGVRWTGAVPGAPFEVELEARRTDGRDFFCGLTVPTRTERECVSLIVGGWGGMLVGISSLDDLDASENETGTTRTFEDDRWYRIRLRFADEQLAAWIDDQPVIEVSTRNRRLSLRPGPIDACAPFGLATWNTGAELRGIRWRRLAAAE